MVCVKHSSVLAEKVLGMLLWSSEEEAALGIYHFCLKGTYGTATFLCVYASPAWGL